MKCSKEINGIHTDIAVSVFQDHVLLLITQSGKFGTVIEATKKNASHSQSRVHVDVAVRLGRRDDPLYVIYARQLLEHISANSIVLAINLEDRSSSTFQTIINLVKSMVKDRN